MINKNPTMMKIGLAVTATCALFATYWFRLDDLRIWLVTIISLSVIAAANHRERQLYPMLFIFLTMRTLEFAFGFLAVHLQGFSYLLLSGFMDFLFAFLLVHYYQDHILQRWCRVAANVPVFPQLYVIAALFGLSCFYRIAAATEVLLFEMDNNFFGDKVPFFFATCPTALTILRMAIDIMLWSMLLFPRKLTQFGHHRPRSFSI